MGFLNTISPILAPACYYIAMPDKHPDPETIHIKINLKLLPPAKSFSDKLCAVASRKFKNDLKTNIAMMVNNDSYQNNYNLYSYPGYIGDYFALVTTLPLTVLQVFNGNVALNML